MSEQWVINASPLIALAHIGQEQLLLKLAERTVIPKAVADEINAGPETDLARQALAMHLFEIIDTPPPSPEILAWDLGFGESAVLSLASLETNWTAILDDRPAGSKMCAEFEYKDQRYIGRSHFSQTTPSDSIGERNPASITSRWLTVR